MLASENSTSIDPQNSVEQISRRVLEAIHTKFLQNYDIRMRRKMPEADGKFPLTLQEMSLVLDNLIRKEVEASHRHRTLEAPAPSIVPFGRTVNVEQKRSEKTRDFVNREISAKKTIIHDCKLPFSDLLRLREQKEALLGEREREINDQILAHLNRKNASVNTVPCKPDPRPEEDFLQVSSKQCAYKNRCVAVDKVDQGTNMDRPIQSQQALQMGRKPLSELQCSPRSYTRSESNVQIRTKSPDSIQSSNRSPANLSPRSVQSTLETLQTRNSLKRDGRRKETSGVCSCSKEEPKSEISSSPRDRILTRRTSNSKTWSEYSPISSSRHESHRQACKTTSPPRRFEKFQPSQNGLSSRMASHNWDLDLSNFHV